MIHTHNLGYPRIGTNRQLKFAQEGYWKGKITRQQLLATAKEIRLENWHQQAKCDFVPVGDFSLYDQVLDTSFMLGNIPERVASLQADKLDNYFRIARGRSSDDNENCCVHAGEMTKWFDTNYHYIVPEVNANTEFSLDSKQLLSQIDEVMELKLNAKPVIIGPVTYLWLCKSKDQSNRLDLLDKLIPVYKKLLLELSHKGIEWVQIDEPILVTEMDERWKQALQKCYQALKQVKVKILLASYFGKLEENLPLVCQLPIDGLHIDTLSAPDEVDLVVQSFPQNKVLSLGIVNGRNIWKTDLNSVLNWLQIIDNKRLGDVWLAPSCSLLHTPVDLDSERQLDKEIKNWLAFARQKIDELDTLKEGLNNGRHTMKKQLDINQQAIDTRKSSNRVHSAQIKESVNNISEDMSQRQSPYSLRSIKQKEKLSLPLFPTTTIGSFPQTQSIRSARLQFKKGILGQKKYVTKIKDEIKNSIKHQESLGLDVFVHGEAERNDMVEYFGERLEGYVISQFGWVQSYGSRCVKPPIIYGDVHRLQSMTVDWIRYAQSLTSKPLKGMLTGPVTLLNWSFVRDDQQRSQTCYQLALAVREEVNDLEKSGIKIIQIDEAALREGLPLRQSQWQEYLNWAVECFKIAASGVKDETQIHTHMCYSEFNDIMEAIAQMDADVITIETSRSDMEILDVFDRFRYPNEIGLGVYDIHSPNVPSIEQINFLCKEALKRLPAGKFWVNPDCGLKTRSWEEVIPALKNMVAAAHELRETVFSNS